MKKNGIFIVLIIALVITTFYNVWDRMEVENAAKEVEITLSYTDMEALSEQSEYDLTTWFSTLKEHGVRSVALEEETLQSLVDDGYGLEMEVLVNVKKDTLWETRYPSQFVEYMNTEAYDKNDVVVVTRDQGVYDFIIEGLNSHYPEWTYSIYTKDSHFAILLDGSPEEIRYNSTYKSYDESGTAISQHQDVSGSDIFYYGLNFSDEKVAIIQKSGLDVHLRPWNASLHDEHLVEVYKANNEKYGLDPRVLIFTGKEALGYPNQVVELEKYMIENQIAPGLIEAGNQRSNADQKGVGKITEDLNYEAVRILPIIGYIQERYQMYNYEGAEEIENTIFRAATERNIRLVYFRPFLKNQTEYITDIDEYTVSFDRLENRLAEHDMTLGQFSVMPFKDDSLVGGIIIGSGLVALLLMALRFFYRLPLKYEYALLLLGTGCVAGALLVSPNLGRQLLALTAAVTISSVGALVLVEFAKVRIMDREVFKTREILAKSLFYTLLFALLATLGGLIVGGLLSHSKYLLEMEFFRGVKVSEMLPLLVFVVIYILKFGLNRSEQELRDQEFFLSDLWKILHANIKVLYIIIGAVIGGILYIYIARSGHETSVQPSNIEMLFRNFLELKLLARPRLKEFMMAIPACVVFVYAAYKAYKPLLLIAGVPAMVMFTSIINTFSHLRTPIYLSFIRTIIGIGFGLVLGFIGIVVLELIDRSYKRFMKRKLSYQNDEPKELGA